MRKQTACVKGATNKQTDDEEPLEDLGLLRIWDCGFVDAK